MGTLSPGPFPNTQEPPPPPPDGALQRAGSGLLHHIKVHAIGPQEHWLQPSKKPEGQVVQSMTEGTEGRHWPLYSTRTGLPPSASALQLLASRLQSVCVFGVLIVVLFMCVLFSFSHSLSHSQFPSFSPFNRFLSLSERERERERERDVCLVLSA